LTDAATNHVYLTVDLTADDAVSVVVNTTGTEPAGAAMKLAIIDTAADTVDVVNSAPDISANELTASAVNADTLAGADVAGAADNQILVTQGDGTLAVEQQGEGPNPYDQAQTFAEAGVTLTRTNTEVSGGSIQLESGGNFGDDFEDGVDAGWSGNTGNLSAQTAIVLTETQSGELTSSNASISVDGPSLGSIVGITKFKVQIDNQTGDNSDYVGFPIYTSGGSKLTGTRFLGDGSVAGVGSSDLTFDIASWSANTTYTVTYVHDFTSEQTEIYINGSLKATVDFQNSASSWDYINVFNYTASSGGSVTAYVDNTFPKTSGDVLIEWDKGVPTDIFAWDVATFTRTLDGETVTVDVEDGNGNVLLSDISRNTDISSIATTENVTLRVNLSRNDMNNNPTLDSAYRSWVV
jgi:hypothetical protein